MNGVNVPQDRIKLSPKTARDLIYNALTGAGTMAKWKMVENGVRAELCEVKIWSASWSGP
jgi:hypothetical protein